jgi:hypothetical protein
MGETCKIVVDALNPGASGETSISTKTPIAPASLWPNA